MPWQLLAVAEAIFNLFVYFDICVVRFVNLDHNLR